MGKQTHHVKRRAKLRLATSLPACETVQHIEARERRAVTGEWRKSQITAARITTTRVATAQPQHRKHAGCTNGPSTTQPAACPVPATATLAARITAGAVGRTLKKETSGWR